MSASARAKFDAPMTECRLHASVLADASGRLPGVFTVDQAGALDVEQRRLLDQAAYRFMKLHDSLGEKVSPGIPELTLDTLPQAASFAEKLQRLERRAALPSAGTWRPLGEVRHALAHDETWRSQRCRRPL